MISIIVATDDDLLIGKKDSSNGMPWHNKEDLQHFKKSQQDRHLCGRPRAADQVCAHRGTGAGRRSHPRDPQSAQERHSGVCRGA